MGAIRTSKPTYVRSANASNPPPTTKLSGFFEALCLPTRKTTLAPSTPKLSSTTLSTEKQSIRKGSRRNSYVSVQTEKSQGQIKVNEVADNSLKVRPRIDSVWLATDFLWQGNLTAPRPYMGLAKEDDLWIPNGDCLVFFEDSRHSQTPVPSLRVESWTIASAGIPFFNDLLSAGRRPRRPSQTTTPQQSRTHTSPNYPNSHLLSPSKRQLRRSSAGYLPLTTIVSPLNFPQCNGQANTAPETKKLAWTPQSRCHSTQSNYEDTYENNRSSYEIWFAVPEYLNDQEQHKHKMAIRNLVAMLHIKPVVGPELIQALFGVQEVLDAFSAQNVSKSSNGRSDRSFRASISMPKKNIITTYLTTMKLDDVRHNLRQALALLRWTESSNVCWSAGYTETFVHIVGMMTPRTFKSIEFSQLSSTSRHNLHKSFNALQVVMEEAEGKLESFDFSEMWDSQRNGACGRNNSFRLFQDFLIDFYNHKYGAWPPTPRTSNGKWLDRDMVAQLQTDFGALYEYLVDRNVQWDHMKASFRRRWEMGRRGNDAFKADAYIPITDMLLEYDDHYGFLHIPNPYPLLPLGYVGTTAGRGSGQSISHVLNASTSNHSESVRTSMAYSAATNIGRLSRFIQGNELLEAFRHHETTTVLDDISLQEARLGRWLLLYGVLQVLSVLSVDVAGLRYTADVDYFLCATLSNPPWRTSDNRNFMPEPAQIRSYCWTASDRWATEKPAHRSTIGAMQLDDIRAHLPRIESPLTDLSSQLTGTEWDDTDIGYSPVHEGAAQALSLQYGIRGKLMDVERGGRTVRSVA